MGWVPEQASGRSAVLGATGTPRVPRGEQQVHVLRGCAVAVGEKAWAGRRAGRGLMERSRRGPARWLGAKESIGDRTAQETRVQRISGGCFQAIGGFQNNPQVCFSTGSALSSSQASAGLLLHTQPGGCRSPSPAAPSWPLTEQGREEEQENPGGKADRGGGLPPAVMSGTLIPTRWDTLPGAFRLSDWGAADGSRGGCVSHSSRRRGWPTPRTPRGNVAQWRTLPLRPGPEAPQRSRPFS